MQTTIIMACLFCLLQAGLVSAAEMKAGFVKNVSGQSFIIRQQKSLPARVGDRVLETDSIKTGPDGGIGIIFQDNSVLGIGPNTQVQINTFAFDPANRKLALLVKIKKGSLVYLAGLIAKLGYNGVKFETPSAVCGIRGTHLAIKVEDGDARDMLPGRVFSSDKSNEE